MADAYGSGPYGRKSLRVQLPFRPFLFGKLSMRKYGYGRMRTTRVVTRKRPTRRKKSYFFSILLTIMLLVGLGYAGYYAARYAIRTVREAQITDWHVRSVEVRGLTGQQEKEFKEAARPFEGKPFSSSDADKLRSQFIKKYPMLSHISVSRGLLSGKLKISAQPRQPIALFVLPDQSYRYVDEQRVVYVDPRANPSGILRVKIIGEVPAELPPSFVDLVHELIRLKKTLAFEALELNANENTVTMRLPGKSVIQFGQATQLKQKVRQAAQIMTLAKQKYQAPFALDFKFFDRGKVFLTQTSH